MRILITAGPTCEDIDEVRFLTNRSSGRTGYAIAAEAVRRGHEVTLASGPVALEPPQGVTVLNIRSADDLHRECLACFNEVDAVIAAAAVADFTPAERLKGKLKKSDNDLVLRLVRTPDVLADLGRRKITQLLIGFALEVDNARPNAEKKLREKRLDAVVLNAPESFGRDAAAFSFLTADGWQDWGRIAKRELASRLLDFVEKSVERGA